MSQPVLGILTLYMNDKKQLEERHIYQKMIMEGQKIGLDVFVFTPMDVYNDKKKIHSLQYDPKTKRWTRRWRSFPHLIFDRCRIQKSKRYEQLVKFRNRYSGLTYLNRPMRDKWMIYQLLSRKPRFKPHLPETVIFQNMSDVYKIMSSHPSVYIKPMQGTGGRGILRVDRVGPESYLLQGRKLNRDIIPAQKVHKTKLESYLMKWKAKKRYLVQQGIEIRLSDGRVHDYRMLVQKNGSGRWEVTGCAGRVGPPRSVTSNLHGGGHAVPMDTLLQQYADIDENRAEIRRTAENLSLDIAEMLETTYGALCELALDLAIDPSGNVYVLEVNPKPAREVFIQSGDTDAYRTAILRPLEYALWMYKQKAAPS
ncbi:YheC/YheD family protein [Paenibacillus lentus]|uniref:YheC/YheD family protein n=1 Tax=Paenibacillus lentus TaxID=1338368 RepID=A0A3Q8SDE1_9BACL|nr:YheC/YheD family protein [Paenibacillus lentus]AZK48116.1 YheC/YheD family protein [Paenibacillus lentus]